MASEKLQKLADSIGLFNERYACVKKERDALKAEVEKLREKARLSDSEREVILEKIGSILTMVDDLI